MYQNWGELINHSIIGMVGVGLIFQYYRKKDKRFLVFGIILVLINGGLITKSLFFDNEEKQQRVTDIQNQMVSGANATDVLEDDSTVNFHNLVRFTAFEGFKLVEVNHPLVKSVTLSKEYDSAIFMIVVVIMEATNGNFERLVKKSLNSYGNQHLKYKFIPNSELACVYKECEVTDYIATKNYVVTSKGSLFHFLENGNFYTIMYANNGIEPEFTRKYLIEFQDNILVNGSQ